MMQTEKIGKYELLERLGRGTSADVYLAKDTLMGRQVALKVVEPETTDLEPFFKEARLLARLQHPNIVTIHSSDLIDGKVVVDMELVEGKTLRQLLRDEKQLSLDRALKIIARILNALAYAHSMGVIHRDIKPANVLIGAEDAVKVVDFGIADVLGTQGYLAGAGTFSHMAPECFLNKSDKRSDIYSVGVILYEMLTGQLPFQAVANSLTAWKEVLDKQGNARPLSELLPNVPNGLQGILSLALAYDKQKRFQAVDAFLDALKRNGLYLLSNNEQELRQIDRFEAAYNRIDKHLREELGADRKVGFADVVRQYAQQNPQWQSEKDLLRLGRVRNKLRHEFTEANQFREVPSAADVTSLEEIVGKPKAKKAAPDQADTKYPIRYDKYEVVEGGYYVDDKGVLYDYDSEGERYDLNDDEEGAIYPLPGYDWLTEADNDLRSVWVPGKVYKEERYIDPSRIASEEVGQWICAPGYEWDTNTYTGEIYASWSPGKTHPDYPNVIASVEEGKWRPAFHYEWADVANDKLLDYPADVVRKIQR